MTFLEELTAHKGGLVRIKTQLFWYDGRGWDGVHDQVGLLLNTASHAFAVATSATVAASGPHAAAALLLADGAPHWVWVAADDLELL